jgi:PEP-CTERM motif
MRKAIDRSFSTRLLRNTALSLALMMASASGVHAQVIGADGANGADGVNPGDPGLPGGDGESVSGSGTVMGGNGGGGGNAAPPDLPIGAGSGGNGGNGGAATATGVDANAVGGNGGGGGSPAAPEFLFGLGGGADLGGNGGNGGNATALATGSSNVSASATGGSGGLEFSQLTGDPGNGGDANATADASAGGGGTATASAVANGGIGGDRGLGAPGAANATSNAETAKGAMAQAQSTAVDGFGLFFPAGEAQSTAKTTFKGVSVQSIASSPTTPDGGATTTDAIAQGGSGQPVPNDLFQTTFAFSTALPDKAYAATLIDGASNVADALLGPDDRVFGIAILGEQGIGDSASSTFDFRFRGDLLLGSIEDDSVTNLGSSAGGIIDLTLSGPGIFVIGGAAVPEPSTWAMMVLGFAGLGFAGYRRARPTRDLAA